MKPKTTFWAYAIAELNGSDEEKEQLAKELAPIIGNRLWDLQDLENDVRKLEGARTLEDLKALVHKRAEILERKYENQLDWCLHYFEQSDKFKDMLHKLLRNESVSYTSFTNVGRRRVRSILTNMRGQDMRGQNWADFHHVYLMLTHTQYLLLLHHLSPERHWRSSWRLVANNCNIQYDN